MESRCSLIRGNVTDKTWASRYMSSPAIQQLLLPDFIVSLVHKSQLPRRAGPRRPAPTIIKIELSLIESNRFSSKYFWCFCLCVFVWMSSYTHPTFCFFFLLPPSPFPLLSFFNLPKSAAKNRPTMFHKKKKDFSFGEITHFPGSLSCLIKSTFSPPRKLLIYNCWWMGKLISMLLQPVCL